MSYFLRLSQLKNLVDHNGEHKLPPLLDKSILFTEKGLNDLKESHNKLIIEIGRLSMT